MNRNLMAAALALGVAFAAPAEGQNLGQILRPDAKTPTTRVGTREMGDAVVAALAGTKTITITNKS